MGKALSEFDRKIIELLKDKPNLKAREIADLLNVDKKVVNSALYSGRLHELVVQDSDYRWKLKNISKEESREETADNIKKYDAKLSNLCNYYLNCLSLEGTTSVSAFRDSKFTPSYSEMKDYDLDSAHNPDAMDFANKIVKSKEKNLYFGYPILIHTIHSIRHSTDYVKIFPIFLCRIDTSDSGIRLSDDICINQEVINCFSENDKSSSIYELIELENDLGLNTSVNFDDLDEIVQRLKMIRAQWNWKEDVDFDKFSNNISLSDINEDGIYNKAILISSEKGTFTLGLENELSILSKMSTDDIKETALYKLLYGSNNADEVDEERQILEVLPLNIEQKSAIQTALAKDVSVITGPPGTGKSQVVSDLIMNMIISNRTILFSSKNNKAVDVVNTRVNEIGNFPVVTKIGGSVSPTELINTLNSIISFPNRLKHDEYQQFINEYNSIVSNFENLEIEKEELINIRNEVDKLENRYCDIRKEYGKYWKKVDEIDINEFLDLKNKYVQSYNSTIKDKQNIFIKLLWPLIENGRIDKYKNYKEILIEFINNLNLGYFLDSNNELDESKLNTELINSFVNSINLVTEYKEKLELLKTKRPLEVIDKELFDVSKQLSEKALEMWNKHLSHRAYCISNKDKSAIMDYITALKLMENDYESLKGHLAGKFIEYQSKIIRYFPCWSVTSLSAKGRIPLTAGMFDLLVIDEASQCDIASIIPLLFRSKRVVAIGDKMQLKHISAITSQQDKNLIDKYNIELKWSYSQNSFYDLVFSVANNDDITDLRDHHRSHSDIISFSNKEFYNSNLRIATDYTRLNIPNGDNPGIKWISCKGKIERLRQGSYVNKIEAKEIINELERLVNIGYKGTIGIVTPFRGQADHIKEELSKNTDLYQSLVKNDILVDTVHKFQGDERDLMIFSTVLTEKTPDSAISFLNSTGNLFNVAITRARSLLVVVGDEAYCENSQIGYLSRFVKYVYSLNKDKESNNILLEDYGCNYPKVDNIEQVSDWEKVLYEKLYENGIKAIPQYPEDKYRLDLALFVNDNKLDIEIDGEAYHKDWNGELCYRDKLRNQRMYELGWDVKRFWVYQIRDDIENCVKDIKEWIDNKQ